MNSNQMIINCVFLICTGFCTCIHVSPGCTVACRYIDLIVPVFAMRRQKYWSLQWMRWTRPCRTRYGSLVPRTSQRARLNSWPTMGRMGVTNFLRSRFFWHQKMGGSLPVKLNIYIYKYFHVCFHSTATELYLGPGVKHTSIYQSIFE